MSTKTTRFPPRAKNKKIAKYHRVHAHSNPLADKFFYYPSKPSEMDWKHYYPTFVEGQSKVENLDIGCGYFSFSLFLFPLFFFLSFFFSFPFFSFPWVVVCRLVCLYKYLFLRQWKLGDHTSSFHTQICFFYAHSYGGLTVALSEKFPNEFTLAMEIRDRFEHYSTKP